MTTTCLARIARRALATALPLAFACTPGSSQSEVESSVPCAECDLPDASPPSPPDAAVPAPDADAEPPPPVCGDGVCDSGEECEADCCDHVCGDGMCGADEDCPEDCDDECTDCCHPEDECCGPDCQPDEETGCTLTQGYWKTHNEYATSPGLQLDWPAPYDEDDLLCGQRLLDVLNSQPRGDAWIILAHQWIAARLNVASGASTTDEVDAALASGETWLLAHCGGVPASEAPDALEWAETLDRYNHGDIGPGHCD